MEDRLRAKIGEAYSKWEEHIDLRFDYASGDAFIPINEFPALFQITFEVIREVNNKYLFESIATKDPTDMMSYMSLLTFISKYVVYDRVEDNSLNKYFTVTSVIAEKLLDYATRVGEYHHPDNDTVVYRDTDEEHRGIFEFWSDDYPPYEAVGGERTKHFYKIYFRDFSDIAALAAKMR